MRISIFGLGYVGTVSSACLASRGHEIIGVDSNVVKVDLLNRGMSPIIEPGIDDLLRDSRSAGRFSATTDPGLAVARSEISLICVGTPSRDDGSLNVDHVLEVVRQIGRSLRADRDYHGIVVRSTVPPGTCETLDGILQQESGREAGTAFGVASNPEFMREGSAIEDFEHPPYTVIGTDDSRLAELLRGLWGFIDSPFHQVRPREAELLKHACNAFHAAKVAFSNEIGAIARSLGIDSHVVMDLLCADRKLNISAAYLKPGFAFGGSCLPKDLRALAYLARSRAVAVSLIEALPASNRAHIQRAVDWVISRGFKKVGILGLSFKSGTDDLRESPVVYLIESLLAKGCAIAVYDSRIKLEGLFGANRDFIASGIPHIASLMRDRVTEVLAESEVIVISQETAEFREAMSELRPDQRVFDLVRIMKTWNGHPGVYEGLCW